MCSGMFQHVCLEQDNLGQKFEDAIDILRQHSMEDLQPSSDKDQKCYQPLHDHYPQIRGYSNCFGLPAISPTEEFGHNWRTVIDNAAVFEGNIYPSLQDITESTLTPPVLCQQKRGKGRKKLRLFEYLYESLCNPEMSSCIQWVDKNKGIFQFISKNKEKLAELWGKRKGNRKMMTYQKMARALRNYASTGEIIKIRRKLTYQFNDLILQRLSPPHILGKELFYSQCVQPDQKYLGSSHWDASYNFAYANHQDLHYPVC